MEEPGLGDIWRMFFWKDPEDHNKGIKCYTYLFIEEYYDYDLGKSFICIEMETSSQNSLVSIKDLFIYTRLSISYDYIVFVEKLA